MLSHRLPLDETVLRGVAGETQSFGIDSIRLVPRRSAIVALAALDLGAVAVLTWGLHDHAALPGDSAGWMQLATLAACSAVIWLLAAHATRLYDDTLRAGGTRLAASAGITSCLAFGPMLLAALGAMPRTAAWAPSDLLWVACAAVWVVMARVVWSVVLRRLLRGGWGVERVMILAGSVSAARLMAAELERRTGGRMRAAASFRLPGTDGGPPMGWVDDAIRRRAVHRVLVAAPEHAQAARDAAALHVTQMGAGVTLMRPDAAPLWLAPAMSDVPSLFDPAAPLSASQALAKRSLDLAVALLVLVLTAPLLLTIALAIAMESPGGVLFRQKREGLNGAVFSMWKFRTMYRHLQDDGARLQTCRNDARVTRLGRFLRKTSLDELPQVMNVLRGDMSIVGPRPHALGMTVAGKGMEALVPTYASRHRMKPGITGWAQVNGCRGQLDTPRALRRRVALDCHYIDNWSFRRDIMIIARTAFLLFLDRHAY